MRKGEDLVSVEITEENPAGLLRNVETYVRRIKEFGSKLEETMEKWSMAIEDKEIKQGEHEKLVRTVIKCLIYYPRQMNVQTNLLSLRKRSKNI